MTTPSGEPPTPTPNPPRGTTLNYSFNAPTRSSVSGERAAPAPEGEYMSPEAARAVIASADFYVKDYDGDVVPAPTGETLTVRQLRNWRDHMAYQPSKDGERRVLTNAADQIEALTIERDEARAALAARDATLAHVRDLLDRVSQGAALPSLRKVAVSAVLAALDGPPDDNTRGDAA